MGSVLVHLVLAGTADPRTTPLAFDDLPAVFVVDNAVWVNPFAAKRGWTIDSITRPGFSKSLIPVLLEVHVD